MKVELSVLNSDIEQSLKNVVFCYSKHKAESNGKGL